VQSADALLIGAGAGMGVDSGLPRFSAAPKASGRTYPPYRELGLNFVDLASPEWFQRRTPRSAWGFLRGHRRNLYRRTVPHAGLRDPCEDGPSGMPRGCFVFHLECPMATFQKAGLSPVERRHGSTRLGGLDAVHAPLRAPAFTPAEASEIDH